MPKRERLYAVYNVSVSDSRVLRRFKLACKYRNLRQSDVILRAMKYFLRHRYAFANGEHRRKGRGATAEKKKPISS